MEQVSVTTHRIEIGASVINVISDLIVDWGVECDLEETTRLVEDLEFESIDVIQLVVALEQQFQNRELEFHELLMVDGRYVDDLTIKQIVDFLEFKLA